MVRWVVICALASARLLSAADLKSEFHEYFQQVCQSKGFMGAASVTVNGEVQFQEACGWADAEWKIKNTVDTRFRTGSIYGQDISSCNQAIIDDLIL